MSRQKEIDMNSVMIIGCQVSSQSNVSIVKFEDGYYMGYLSDESAILNPVCGCVFEALYKANDKNSLMEVHKLDDKKVYEARYCVLLGEDLTVIIGIGDTENTAIADAIKNLTDFMLWGMKSGIIYKNKKKLRVKTCLGVKELL